MLGKSQWIYSRSRAETSFSCADQKAKNRSFWESAHFIFVQPGFPPPPMEWSKFIFFFICISYLIYSDQICQIYNPSFCFNLLLRQGLMMWLNWPQTPNSLGSPSIFITGFHIAFFGKNFSENSTHNLFLTLLSQTHVDSQLLQHQMLELWLHFQHPLCLFVYVTFSSNRLEIP